MYKTFLSLSLSLSLNLSFSQTCQDASVELIAEVQSDPPVITLNWVDNLLATQYFVYRKLKTGTAWGAVIGNLPGDATSFTDTLVEKGISYEYRVRRETATFTAWGYINAGIEIPETEDRGILILVVDDRFADTLQSEIERLKNDMEGDGWQVCTTMVADTITPAAVRDQIRNIFNENPAMTKAVFLLGHVPVPYSGELNPDGHGDHIGAWPADVYYGEMNGTWTDNVVNNVSASDPRNDNVPGDGKFDQSIIPSDIELQVGRVDFFNMPAFPISEEELLRNYLNKDHAYRHRMFIPEHRAVIDDNFGYFGGEAFAASGWKNFSPLVGSANVMAGDYFTTMANDSYLWSYGCGGGNPTGAGGIGSTGDFVASDLQSVFTILFGSYFGDWGYANNFLRAPLAQGTTLTNVWSGRPHWMFHHMGLGENIGYSTRLTQNNNGLYFFSYGARFIHLALMGDPTLRNHVVGPPKDVVANQLGYGTEITWEASDDDVLGYHLYYRGEQDASFHRINSELVRQFGYVHECVSDQGIGTYMVRAVKLEDTPSGTYYNLSQGMMDTAFNDQVFTVLAAADWNIMGNEVTMINLSANATTFFWDFGDGTISSEINPVHSFLDGQFLITLIASNECDADTFLFEVSILTGMQEPDDDAPLMISPNPSNGQFDVVMKDGKHPALKLYLIAADGSLVWTSDAISPAQTITVRGISQGVYILMAEYDQHLYRQKVMVLTSP